MSEAEIWVPKGLVAVLVFATSIVELQTNPPRDSRLVFAKASLGGFVWLLLAVGFLWFFLSPNQNTVSSQKGWPFVGQLLV